MYTSPISTSGGKCYSKCVKPRRFLFLSLIGAGVIAVFAIIVLVLFGKWGGPVGEGDPGGKRLQELLSDPIFAVMPAGSTDMQTTSTPARYQDNGWFEPSGWRGPSITMSFKNSASSSTIRSFYEQQATSDGWRHDPSLNSRSWLKVYPNGAKATFILISFSRTDSYLLTGSIEPAAWQ